jgi:hypothetical protein
MLCWTKWWLWSSPWFNSSTIVANYDDALLVIDGDSPTIEFCFNAQCLEIDEIELENVIKGGCKVNKHVDLWAKNTFDEWRKFWRYDIKIYSRFVWECKDHQGTWWYIRFLCVTRCKKKWYYLPSNQVRIFLFFCLILLFCLLIFYFILFFLLFHLATSNFLVMFFCYCLYFQLCFVVWKHLIIH